MMSHKTKDKMISKELLLYWIDKFILSVPRLAGNTRQIYRNTLLGFVVYLEKIPDKEKFPQAIVKLRIIAGWLKQVRARYSLCTLMHRAGIMNRFFSFLEENGWVQKNPLGRLQKKYPKEGLKGIVMALVGPSPQKSLQDLKVPPRFSSPLGTYMQKFITLGRSWGKNYRGEESVLRCFDHFLMSYSDPPRQVTDSIIRQWLRTYSKHKPGNKYKNFRVISNFCVYLRRFDPKAYVPPSSLCKPPREVFLPYIYTRSEIASILKAAGELDPSSDSRSQRFYIVILLLYTTGMRISEALNLQLRDIDRKSQTLCIRKTKFSKSRFVPLSSSMMRELKNYLKLRQEYGIPVNPESYLFQNPHRKGSYSRASIEAPFRGILQDLGLKLTRGPRLHDLRATFAVHRLEEWYRQGVNVQAKLGLLSTYLGHVNISGTQRYLPMTAELLDQASHLFEEYFYDIRNKENQNGEK